MAMVKYKALKQTESPLLKIQRIVTDAAKPLGEMADTEVNVADAKFGDFTTNIAMKLSKRLSRPPLDIAKKLAENLSGFAEIEKAEVAGPGFVNITLTVDYWKSVAEKLDELTRQRGPKGIKIQVEFISANPTGPLTLGNARGGFVGDVLANVFEVSGFNVTREYYFNDAGTQITRLAESIWPKLAVAPPAKEPEYSGVYLKEVAARVGSDFKGPNDGRFRQAIVKDIFDHYIRSALEKAGIKFDVFTNERVINRKFPKILEQLDQQELIEEREGAIWLKSAGFGDRRDRVLVKSGGDHTYLANDIAYHHDIFVERNFDKAIKVWGADHAGQVPSLKLTVDKLFPNKEIEFVVVQWVRLIRNGHEFKISKRAGTYITVDELIERVGPDVARWFMMMRSNDTPMDFDLDLAEEQSQKNPFWYVMYAYVRARAIQREALQRGLKPSATISQYEDVELAIVKKLSQFPDILSAITQDYGVHRLTFYGQELAKLFHEWYEAVRVVEQPAEKAGEKLLFLQRFTQVLERYYAVVGIKPKEHM